MSGVPTSPVVGFHVGLSVAGCRLVIVGPTSSPAGGGPRLGKMTLDQPLIPTFGQIPCVPCNLPSMLTLFPSSAFVHVHFNRKLANLPSRHNNVGATLCVGYVLKIDSPSKS